LTRKARESKAAREARKAAERQAEQQTQQREEQERVARLRPLAERVVAALEPNDVAALLKGFGTAYYERQTLLRLLGEVAR